MNPAYPVRASDAEREATVALLHAATAEGRLSLAEFSDRSQLAYAAVTRADLAVLVADLPFAQPPPLPPPPPIAPAPPAQDRTSLAALICGILALAGMACMPFGVLAAPAGIACGIISLRNGRRGRPANRAMALVGIIGGTVGVLAMLALALFVVLPAGP